MADTRPNFVIITLHDLGRHLRCYDADLPATPNIERIAENGVTFRQHYGTCPLCSPSRASIVTGRYPHSNGMDGLTHRGFRLNQDERTAAGLCSELGYHTALYGHQHEATPEEIGRLGYQEVVTAPDLSYRCGDVAPRAAEFLMGNHDRPFLLAIGSTEVHRAFKRSGVTPIPHEDVTVPPYLPDCPEVREDLADFYGMVQTVDPAMKIILDALDSSGLAEDTLLLFTTDHGFAFPRAKSTLYDPGIGVTLLAQWPGTLKAGTCIDGLTSHVDILPTLLELAGASVPDSVEGTSLRPLLFGDQEAVRQEVFAEKSWHGNEYDPMRCIRTERYKYIRNFTEGYLYQSPGDIKRSLSGRAVEESRRRPRPMTELYDLRSDPDEFDNLSGKTELAEVEERLDSALSRWMQQTGDSLPGQHIPWPVPEKEHFLNNMDCPMPAETD